jgi:hypothetical protein
MGGQPPLAGSGRGGGGSSSCPSFWCFFRFGEGKRCVVPVSLTKAAEKGGENLADVAKAAVGRLVGWLRGQFTQTGDDEGSQALAWPSCGPAPGRGHYRARGDDLVVRSSTV